jgi:hypothetical protein
MRTPACLTVLLVLGTLLSPGPAGVGPAASQEAPAPAARDSSGADGSWEPAPAVADTAGAADSTGMSSAVGESLDIAEGAGPAPPLGGEIGTARLGLARLLADRSPSVRLAGTGWSGHPSSAGAGVVPPSLTRLVLRGRRFDDWIEGGLDLLGAARPKPGTLLVPGGPDLSLWPVLTVGPASVASPGGGAGTAPLAVEVAPGRRPSDRPFARLNLQAGEYGRNATALEFGRRYRDEATSTFLFLETENGRAPVPGGSYDIGRAGSVFSARFGEDRSVDVGVTRVDLTRGLPYPGLAPGGFERRLVRSDLFVAVSGDRSRVELFHTQTWLESSAARGELRTESDGVLASLSGGSNAALVIQLERRSARGDLLSDGIESFAGLVEGRAVLTPGARELTLTAGLDLLDEVVLPLGGARLAAGSPGAIEWFADARLCGRHPTVQERRLVELAVPTEGGDLTVSGRDGLDPERAFVLTAGASRRGSVAGVSASAQFVRLAAPIVLTERDGRAAPSNEADANGATVSLRASVGDSAGPTALLDLGWASVDSDGALAASAPVPVFTAGAEASFPVSLFEDYLETRWEVTVAYETGRARGAWEGVADDSRLTAGLAMVGRAGSAEFYVAAEDVFETGEGLIDVLDPGGRRLSAGFSWRFWD